MDRCTWISLLTVLFLAVVLYRLSNQSNETWLPTYDYIIVGGGTAGSILANRLSADPNNTVLLLEAGGNHADGCLWMNTPLAAPLNFFTNSMYWADVSATQQYTGGACLNHQVPHPHGKILGGSSSINMMIYTRGNPADYDSWQNGGADGWAWKDVEPYFRIIEQANGIPQSDEMGKRGPQHLAEEKPFHTISQYILNASSELGVDINSNYNGESMLGTGLVQSMVHNGKRWSVTSAYLEPALNRDNLHVVTEAHVIKVLTEEATATGVQFIKHNVVHEVTAIGEVVLSAGAYNSPHLLLLSGIGPKDQLQEHQIGVVADLPGVGENLHDHAAVSENVFTDSLPGVSLSLADLRLSNILEYLYSGTGLLAENMFTALTFLSANETSWFKSADEGDSSAGPEIEIMYSVMPLGGGIYDWGLSTYVYEFLNLHKTAMNQYYNNHERPFGTALVVVAANPRSRGFVRLRSSDPMQRPLIDAKLMSHPRDRAIMRQAMRFVHSMAHTRTMESIGGYLLDERQPERQRACSEFTPYSDEYIDCYIAYNSGTAFHGVGSCKMGKDPMAVVDPKLRVHGMRSLRVVDASVMPCITSANSQAPTMVIAERAAEFILADARAARSCTLGSTCH